MPDFGEKFTEVLFREKRMKALEVFLDNPDKEFTLTEICDISEVSKPTVIALVDKLEDLGILDRKKKGNAYLVSLNESNPYVERLEEIMQLDTEPLVETAEELTGRITEELEGKIASIVLFGSVARGIPKTDSDIDILFVLENENNSVENQIRAEVESMRDKTGFNISPLILEASEVVERVEKGGSFIKSVIEEGDVLYGGDKWSEITGGTV